MEKKKELKDINFDDLQSQLEGIKSPSGETLVEHLNRVFKTLILHYPDQALARFEEVSTLIKQKKDLNEFLKLEDIRTYKEVASDQAAYTGKVKGHFEAAQPDEEGNIPEQPAVGYVQDLMKEARIFQWAGISFGEQETYRLQKSLKKLSEKVSATQLRFFGKIHGTEKDFYIVEATLGEGEGEDDGEKPADVEPKGTGVNTYTYFVTQDSMSEWIKLPDLTPQELAASREIKVLFTGNLERQIYTNPYFFGQEKHYLRAQISRIIHSTTLFPKGLMRKVEDEERKIEPNEPEEGEYVNPTTTAMSDKNMWVHA
jgi:hypothetical protein